MPLNDVNVALNDGGLGRREPSLDMVCGLVTNAVSVVGGLQNSTAYELKSLNDLVALGVTASYDTTNGVLLYHTVKEFFRMNVSGTLWLYTTAQGTTMTAMMGASGAAKSLLVAAGGVIRVLGVSLNPASGYTPTLTAGLDNTVSPAVSAAQALAEAEFTAHRPVQFIVEGRSFNGTASSALDLRTLDAENVSVVIAQDKAAVDAAGAHAGAAAIGTLLGTVSRAKVNESVCWVERFNIQSVVDQAFLTPELSSGNLVTSYSDTDLSTLNDKGYVFARVHTGLSGAYWSDSHTCKATSSDYSYIENNRVAQKAARLIRTAFLPKLGSPVLVDETTGKLDRALVTYFEGLGSQALNEMGRSGEVSGFDVVIDPEQDILSTSQLVVRYSITPTGTARRIVNQIFFNNPF